MTPGGFPRPPRARQNDPKRSLRGSKKRPQTTRRQKGRTKTFPRPSWTPQGPISTAQPPLPDTIWGAKTTRKPIPKQSRNDPEKIPNRPRHDPESIPNQSQSRSRIDPESIPKRSQINPKTIPERSRNDPNTTLTQSQIKHL